MVPTPPPGARSLQIPGQSCLCQPPLSAPPLPLHRGLRPLCGAAGGLVVGQDGWGHPHLQPPLAFLYHVKAELAGQTQQVSTALTLARPCSKLFVSINTFNPHKSLLGTMVPIYRSGNRSTERGCLQSQQRTEQGPAPASVGRVVHVLPETDRRQGAGGPQPPGGGWVLDFML